MVVWFPDTTQSPMTLETMTELVESNTQLHKILEIWKGLWSIALLQHKLQQHFLFPPCHIPTLFIQLIAAVLYFTSRLQNIV